LDRRKSFHLPWAGRFLPPLGDAFVSIEALSGLVLFACALVALLWANVDSSSYEDVWGRVVTIGGGDAALSLDLRHWVNDGLMTIFFFVVALEIKREVLDGELSDRRAAALPALAALGGMVFPALIFVAVNLGSDGGSGWGIPMATDIAFAVGVLALLGSRVRSGLKLFLLTLAIVDDVGAIVVIALFYSKGVDAAWLFAAAATIIVIVAMRRIGFRSPWWYLAPAIALWIATQESGVHATIAGVVLGLLTPGAPGPGTGPLERLEQRLHPWSSFVIVPVFAIANAGVLLTSSSIEAAASSSVAWGIVLGLVVGKTLGITSLTYLGLRLGWGRLPSGVQPRDVIAVAAVAGIGFTVSLFVADLSFAGALLDEAKVGILAASVAAGALGAFLVRMLIPSPSDSRGTASETAGS
jgi:Na+:H+ antiporter, NhaA family